MTREEYLRELGKVRASRLNTIASAVNRKLPIEESGANTEVEKMYYESLMRQAKEHEKKYGFWPTFEMEEIESDDPLLDIYHS